MFSINFNNLNSYEDLGLYIEHRPCVPIPNRNINLIEIQGRDGTLTEDLGTYEDIQININFGFKDKSYYNKLSKLKSWLCNVGDKKLIFSDNDDMYYKVKKVECENIERSLRTLGRFAVNFTCEPFLYYVDEEITLTSDDTIRSPEFAYKSEPIIKIYGSGDITLNINSESIKLENVENYITIDSALKECYKDDVNMNSNMYGDFPHLNQGRNSIDWSGNVDKIKIKTNWRCL